MPDADDTTHENSEKELSPDEKAKLLRELRERLKEIARLREELGMQKSSPLSEEKSPREEAPSASSPKNNSSPEDDLSHPVSAGRVAEEVEELHVPALEMLDDKPMMKKKKEGN